jgi:hypothetical protein
VDWYTEGEWGEDWDREGQGEVIEKGAGVRCRVGDNGGMRLASKMWDNAWEC